MERPKERGRHRNRVETEMIKRRDKEFAYQQMWSGTDKYFRHWDKANTRYDSWTSPRYYEDNNKLLSEIRNKREKEELLEKRREKLKKLLDEDRRTYEIELMVHKAKNISQQTPRSKLDEVPTDVLKQINVGLKLEEERRRRHEAETKLYHQWRKNNPIVRQYESKYRCKDLKLSWLDQQIEKQMRKEKEEEESRRILKERDERIKRAEVEEELHRQQLKDKREELKRALEEQMLELRRKQDISDELKKKEECDSRRKGEIAELLEKQVMSEKQRAERECALYNIRQHKLKLKKRAAAIQEDLMQEKLMVAKLKELKLEDVISDELKRKEIQEGLVQFAKLIKEQQELERQRHRYLEFLFDSEAKSIYEKQTNIWRQEEQARQNLLKTVIHSVQAQIEENLEKNRERQRQILVEREEMSRKIEEYDNELRRMSEEEERKKLETRKMVDDDVKVKNARKKLQENLKLKEINEELDRIKKEEERLQQEIVNIQQRQGPYKLPRSRLFL
ncbi:hypothetical protein NQ318_002199 [Aromia moschata]|uniref:Trichoplein keratin filament-binding protein n=1 Tax=Aromia moschata TaxID=1265417 RepID=A0AAV8Z507_9CUCU|nr:hypothetical protein NQ318_002199 [Aromia moschata]